MSGSGRVPTSIGPELTAHYTIADHEADRICDLLRLNQTAKLGAGEDVFLDKAFGHGLEQGCIYEAWMNDAGAHTD